MPQLNLLFNSRFRQSMPMYLCMTFFKDIERHLKITFIFVLFAQPHTVGASDSDDTENSIHEVGIAQKHRSQNLRESDVSKMLSFTYDDFYHRHDVSACYYLGQALLVLDVEHLDEGAKKTVVDDLTSAKRYCTEDRQNRKDTIKHVRNALRTLKKAPFRGLASEE